MLFLHGLENTEPAERKFMRVMMIALVARRGFEPRQTESKSVVLPLYYRALSFEQAAKIRYFKNVPMNPGVPESIILLPRDKNAFSLFEPGCIFHATTAQHPRETEHLRLYSG